MGAGVGRRNLFALAGFMLAGCLPSGQTERPGDAVPPPRPELGAAHDPAACGTVRGRVTWAGAVPQVPPLLAAFPAGDTYTWATKPAPFAPRVGPAGGLANAIVTLKQVDLSRSKPWDRPPLRIEMKDFTFRTPTGEPFVAGVVRTGDNVEFVSRDPELHAARARGAAFFALSFPRPDQELSRPLLAPGIVELSSGAGYYWMAADVLVSDHPYADVTGPDGAFTLAAVPAGDYDLECRVRNWQAIRQERDPESGLPFRQYYAPPVILTGRVTVTPQGTVTHDFALTAAQFPARP